MTSEVSICNLSLSNIGKTNISSLNEATAEARCCKQFYAHSRDVLLASYPWIMAGKTIALAALATNPKPGAWLYAYRRPNDMLKFRWVRPAYSEDDTRIGSGPDTGFVTEPYDIEGEVIYCNIENAFLRYTFTQTDVTKYGPLFVDALSWILAARLAMPLTKDPKVRADAYNVGQQMSIQAQVDDANQVRVTSDITSDFVEARDPALGLAAGHLPSGAHG